MGRPADWRDRVRRYGWGTAPARLMARSRLTEEGCLEWTGAMSRNVPQIRVTTGTGCYWLISAQRLAWMIANRRFVDDSSEVKRTCCNDRCLLHLTVVPIGTIGSVCEYRNQRQALHDCKHSRKLTDRQVATIRRWVDEGRVLAPLADRYRVSKGTIYSCANGFTFRHSWITPLPDRVAVGHYRRDAVHYDRKAGT